MPRFDRTAILLVGLLQFSCLAGSALASAVCTQGYDCNDGAPEVVRRAGMEVVVAPAAAAFYETWDSSLPQVAGPRAGDLTEAPESYGDERVWAEHQTAAPARIVDLRDGSLPLDTEVALASLLHRTVPGAAGFDVVSSSSGREGALHGAASSGQKSASPEPMTAPEGSHRREAASAGALAPTHARNSPAFFGSRVAENAILSCVVVVLALVASLLFTRISADRALAHETRSRIVEALRASPGLTLAEVARAVEIELTLARYHVRRLVKLGVIIERDAGRARYAIQGFDFDPAIARATATPVAKRVVEAFAAGETLGASEVARRAALSRQLVSYHLKNLAAAGAITRAGSGARPLYRRPV